MTLFSSVMTKEIGLIYFRGGIEEYRNSKWNAKFLGIGRTEYCMYSVCFTSENGIVGRAGVAGTVVID